MSHQDCNDPAMVSDDSVVVASSSSSSPGFTNNKELKRLDEIQSSSLSNDSNDGGPDDDDDDDDEIDDYDCDIHQRKDPAHIIQRSESVIKSPSKLAAPTPVIQVIDTASGPSANTDGDNQKKYSSPPPSICSPSSSSNGANFLLSSNIAPNNPFLRATSFHQNSSLSSSTSAATTNCADGDASDSSSTESQIIFAPPKLIPSSLGPNSTSSSSSGSFLQPSVLKTFDNSSSDIRKPNETISASKTFISLNKADIGKIKTPSFIKLSSPLSMTLSSANGSNMISSSLATSTNDETNKSVIKSPASTMMVDGGGSRAFLFGQKVEDRVVIDQSSDSVTNSQATAATSSSSLSFQTNASTTAAAAVSSSSSSSCLLSFSDVSNCEESTINTFTQQNPDDHPDSSTSFMSIMKNGADNNADSIFKRKYEVITGEEDEQNVLSIHGRLYAWDTDKATWVEKGRGPLHLNDVMKDEKLCSRLVMRTAGAYRLILNALIVAGMTFELASENCLRFTYIDGIYMIKANPKDIDQLHSAIEHRLREISKRMRSQDD